uniref:Uncharacterized protein n=1 Tax=blood disease bacterium R229 TaxID=741978 RepID=G2ZU32_9RALS|nr:hypothetical protein BDB_mp10155 [blood disease bacterium R229]
MKRAHPPASKLSLTDLAALREQLKHETEQREAERQRAKPKRKPTCFAPASAR